MQDPHRLAAPFDDLLLARGKIADVDLDRSPHGLGALRRKHEGGKRSRHTRGRHAASASGGNDEIASAVTHALIIAHEGPFPFRWRIFGKCGIIPNGVSRSKFL